MRSIVCDEVSHGDTPERRWREKEKESNGLGDFANFAMAKISPARSLARSAIDISEMI